MARHIDAPTTIPAAGEPPKLIQELVGRVNSETDTVSIAVMEGPSGWIEPGQTPDFEEYTVVLDGELQVESADADPFTVTPGQAVIAPAGEWVRYSTPGPDGARYVAVCLPAFSLDLVHRDDR
jgi:quercetin dioxygenase-like cupin family protein